MTDWKLFGYFREVAYCKRNFSQYFISKNSSICIKSKIFAGFSENTCKLAGKVLSY